MIEIMVAMLLTAIAVVGLIGLYRVQTRSSAFSRRSTEAAVLAGDKMEALRIAATPANGGPESVQPTGEVVTGGTFTRTWTVTNTGTQYDITVVVSWDDDGTARNVTLRSFRGL